jgi:hypothetical protein
MYLQCKIIVFREAAFIANTLMSARIFFRCCYALDVNLSDLISSLSVKQDVIKKTKG